MIVAEKHQSEKNDKVNVFSDVVCFSPFVSSSHDSRDLILRNDGVGGSNPSCGTTRPPDLDDIGSLRGRQLSQIL